MYIYIKLKNMNIKLENLENLNQKGVYLIKNGKTNKKYIGSTSRNFLIRFTEHFQQLSKNLHKNPYLQKAWNKYGKDLFIFEILEICENFEERETFYLNHFKKSELYNLNFTANRIDNKNLLTKRKNTLLDTNVKIREYYNSVKNNQISLEDVPKKYKKAVVHHLTKIIWNKGLTKNHINYDYLKVPKTKTEKYFEGRLQFKEKMRSKKSPILVYSIDYNFIKEFRSIRDFIEWSEIENNNLSLPLILKNPNGRNNINPRKFSSMNISNVLHNKSKHYKGLIFQYKPLHEEIHVEKLGKIEEPCDGNIEIVNNS